MNDRRASNGVIAARASVLVIDDDETVRDIMSDVLDDAGYDVRTAEDGADALRLLHASAVVPSLILLDVEMPRMCGRAFLAARAKEAALQAIPVVVTSATAGHLEGAQAFVRKPVDLGRLLGIVASICRRPRP